MERHISGHAFITRIEIEINILKPGKKYILSHRGDELEGEQPVTVILDATHPDQGQDDVHGALHGQWLGAAVEQGAQHLAHRCRLATARQAQPQCHQILA